MLPNDRLAGVLAVVLAALMWGTTGTAATFSVGVPRMTVSAAGSVVGGSALILGGVPAMVRQRKRIASFGAAKIVIGMVGVAAFPMGFYTSMQLAGVAVGTVITIASSPIIGGLIEMVTERRRLSNAWYVAACLGVIGAVTLCLSRLTVSTMTGLHTIIGVLLALVSGAVFAWYSWIIRQMMSSGISRNATMGTLFSGAVPILAVLLVLTGGPLLEHRVNLTVAAYLAVVPVFLAYVLYGQGLARVSASTALTITLLEPTVASLLAVAVVGERLSWVSWCGMGLIAAALVVTVVQDTSSMSAPHTSSKTSQSVSHDAKQTESWRQPPETTQ